MKLKNKLLKNNNKKNESSLYIKIKYNKMLKNKTEKIINKKKLIKIKRSLNNEKDGFIPRNKLYSFYCGEQNNHTIESMR
jgi:hypothetical protein